MPSLICFPWICWKTAGICWKSVAWYVTDAGKTCYLTNGKSGFNYYCTWIVFLPLNCRNLLEMPSFIVFLEMPSLISAFALQGGICWKRLPWSVLIGEWLETIPSLICVPWSLPLHWRKEFVGNTLICLDWWVVGNNAFFDLSSLISAFALQESVRNALLDLSWVLIGEWLETMPSLICLPWSLPLNCRNLLEMPSLISLYWVAAQLHGMSPMLERHAI